jgi:hypothetical protein
LQTCLTSFLTRNNYTHTSQGDLQRGTYTTFTETARKLYAAGGIRRIFGGCMWRTVNVTATVYVANECRVRLSPYLHDVNI